MYTCFYFLYCMYIISFIEGVCMFAVFQVLLLIEKKAHAYVFASIGCKKWDTCAPEAILTSIGGSLTDIHGKPIPYHANVVHKNTGGVLATVDNHEWYVNKIKERVDPETLAKFESVKPAPPSLEAQLSQRELNVSKPGTEQTDQVNEHINEKTETTQF